MTGLRWGLLSTAAIGATVIGACRDSRTVQFVAVASRDPAKASAFAREHGLEHAFGSYEEMLASAEVDAVHVALPALTVDVPAADIRRNRALGGGALGDLGCYCVSGIRYFAGEPLRGWKWAGSGGFTGTRPG